MTDQADTIDRYRVVKVEELTGRDVSLQLIHTPSAIAIVLTWQRRATPQNRDRVIEEMLSPLGLMEGLNGRIVPFVSKLERMKTR